MTTRQQQKADTRARILEAAKNVFEEEGFEAANLRRVAKDAGVVAGTIFVHFQDKRDLLHTALFEDLQSTLREALSQPAGRSLEAWLEAFTDRALSYYERRPTLSRVLLKESLLAEPPWGERFSTQMAELHGGVQERTARAIEAGEFSEDLSPPVFAAAFVSFYVFGLVAWAQNSHPDPRGLIQTLVAHHMGGYRKK